MGLCKLVAVLFFFSSIVTQCSCFFCLFFVGFFFFFNVQTVTCGCDDIHGEKPRVASWLVCIRRVPPWLSIVEQKLGPALLLRVNAGVKETRGFLLRAGATLLMVKILAGLLPSMWQKCLIIKMDPPMFP